MAREIGGACVLDKSTVTSLLARMEKQGLICRRPSLQSTEEPPISGSLTRAARRHGKYPPFAVRWMKRPWEKFPGKIRNASQNFCSRS